MNYIFQKYVKTYMNDSCLLDVVVRVEMRIRVYTRNEVPVQAILSLV